MAANDDDWLNLDEEWLNVCIDEADKPVKVAQPEAETELSGSKNLEDEFCVLDDETLCVEACTKVADKAIQVDRCYVETLDKAVDATQFVETMIQTPPVQKMDNKAVDATPEFEPAEEAQTVLVEVVTKKKVMRAPEEIIRSFNVARSIELEKAIDRATDNLTESLNRAFSDFAGDTPPQYHGNFVKQSV
jgi:hypothetical protein